MIGVVCLLNCTPFGNQSLLHNFAQNICSAKCSTVAQTVSQSGLLQGRRKLIVDLRVPG